MKLGVYLAALLALASWGGTLMVAANFKSFAAASLRRYAGSDLSGAILP